MSLELQKRTIDTILIIDLNGRLMDITQIDPMQEWIDLKSEDENAKIIFNLSHLDYINSSGLNLFIKLFTRIRNKGGELVFCNLSPKVSELLIMTKLNKVFNIEETEEKAVKFFKS